jgi:protein MAK11
MKYVSLPLKGGEKEDFLAVSTEDGRVIFYSTRELKNAEDDTECSIPHATPIAQVGGKQAGFPGRIKDFEILTLEGQAKEFRNDFLVVTANSDGVVRVWKVGGKEVSAAKQERKDTTQFGKLLTTNETGNRITCMAAFVMLPAEDPSTLIDSEDDSEDEVESSSDSDDE